MSSADYLSPTLGELSTSDDHSIDLSDKHIRDDDIKILCKGCKYTHYINLSGTQITLASIQLIKTSPTFASKDRFSSHPNYGSPVSYVTIKIDDTPAAKEFTQSKDDFDFIHKPFTIHFTDHSGSDIDGIKQVKIELNGSTYSERPCPSYFELIRMPRLRNSNSYNGIPYSDKNFITLLDNMATELDKGTITRLAGYNGYNGNRDFKRLRKMESNIPAEDSWNMIELGLKHKGKSIKDYL